MALTQDELNQVYNYIMEKGQSLAGLPDGGTDLSSMYLAPLLKYSPGGSATLVRLAVSLLKGDSAYQVWVKEPGNAGKSLSDFFAFIKGAKGDPFTFADFTSEQLAGLALTYEKLTPAQKEEMKLHFSDLTEADILVLQKPATDAAAEVRQEMTQISQDVSQKMTDLRQLEATVSEQEETRENSYTQWQAAEQGRQNDELKRKEAAAAAAEAERLRVLKEEERNATFNTKIQEASDAAAEAKTQGDYAKRQGDKAAILDGRVSDLEEGKVDGGYVENGELQFTSNGLPVGDPIPVGSGGGGGGTGGGGVLMKVRAIGETLISAIQGGTLRIGYNFVSTYMDDQSETGDGTATYTINSQKVATEAITQGDNYFDVTKYLVLGTNKVKVTVLDSTGQSRSVLFTVEVISLSLSDSYDDAQVNSGEITYRYIPTGAIAKTVHFILDGKEIGTEETTVSNRQLSFVIPAQSHGAHRLTTYMTATVNGLEVRSNELAHDLICVAEGNNTIIVASSFNQSTAKQYDRLSIPFVVYTPGASTSAVTLSVNDEVLSEQTVDRTKHEWNYRITKPGALALKIASGDVSRTFNLNVSEAEILVEAETADLELYLTSQNRSNNDNNRADWRYGDIESSMTGFNWKTNGWLTDDKGSTCLRVSGGASVDIPLKIFEQDLRSSGKTFEVEFLVRDVYRYDTPIISCWSGNRGILITSQSAQIKSEQSDITTKFKDEERIRLAFVVEKKADNRLLAVYVNGIKSISFQYPETDNFMQAEPVNITIGGEDATVDLYKIRSYNNNLNRYQLINNFIADIDDYDRKLEVYHKNDIYDAYGNISFVKVRKLIDILVLEGDLPQYKGDKKKNKLYHYSALNAALNWWANIINDVQGTSSQYYPRKNNKLKLVDGLTYIESGEHADAFQITEDVLPASIFCIKEDFAESSGTYNTGVANYADWMLKEMGILTEAQKEDPNVRTTIAGKPCALFHKATPDSEPVFIGKVNFNTDKAAEETFGFKDGDESWEFLNNTSDMALFKSADFTKWQETIEARYPDGGADISNVKVIFDWVVSCKGNPEKFKAECDQYFDKEMLVFYALITLVLGMTDQRAKNMFLTRYRGKLWLFILYDNDTLLPINNEGLIALLYNVETQDKVNGANVWNGADSELWKLVEEAFADEIREMYYTMRQRNILSYDRMMEYLYSRQAGKWCEAIYNEDGYYKYEQPLIEGYLDYSQSHENPQIIKTGAYLYALQGSREMYGKWIWKNRFLYLDSKFLAGSILGDTAVFRTYTPAVWAGVKPCADITLTAFNAMYFNVKWGSVTRSQRVGFNETVTMTAPENMQFNDTETIIYGASLIASLGDLSPLYPGTVDVSKMTKLKELIVGSGAEGYQNRNLHSLSIGENRLLKKLDVRNCPEYSEPIDVRNCTNIEEIYAQGTAITAVNLPEGGSLSKLYLPGTITNLSLKNQPKLLDAYFELADVEKLSTIVCENTPGINIFPIVDRCLSMKNPALSRVRLIDLNATGANLDILYKLIRLGGVDEKGNNVPTAVVTGKFHAVTAVEDKLAAIRAAFPELTVTYTNLKPPTITTFTFSSAQWQAIKNSTFECNFDAIKVSETTYNVTAEDNSIINFTFKCDNHVDYTDTYLVLGTRSQAYKVTYIPLRKIRVQVYGQSIYVAGARIIIGEDVYVTDLDGYVTLKRGGGAVSGTVEASGYAGNAFSFPVITNDSTNIVNVFDAVEIKFVVKNGANELVQNLTVTCEGKSAVTNIYGECTLLLGKGTHEYTLSHPDYLDKTDSLTVGISAKTVTVYTSAVVTFHINDESNRKISGATVKCDNREITNDENGVYSMMLNPGTYEYSIQCLGYHSVTGSVQITTYNTSRDHRLEYNIIELKPEKNGNVQMLALGPSISLGIVNPTADFTIDWGDGITESGIEGQTQYLHTYPDTSFYQIEINNCSEMTYANIYTDGTDDTRGLVAYWSIGSSKIKNLNFNMYGALLYLDLDDILVNDTKRKSFWIFMSRCSKIKNVDLSYFRNLTEITEVSSFISNCFKLEDLDLRPFATIKGIMNAKAFAYNASRLRYVLIANETPWPIDVNAFSSHYPIYVPDSLVETYKAATNWSNLTIKPMSDFATDFPDVTI